ncbi:MAG: MIP/aquaporin family protein [Pseudomonadota bacterium]
MAFDLSRRLAAEFMGTGTLVCAVVGSGIMAERLTPDTALALLANGLATAAILVVLITTLGPISGAHFNPAVTAVFASRGWLPAREALAYAGAQVLGALVGTAVAHMMFVLPLFTPSMTPRIGPAQWLAEIAAAFGLVAAILGGLRFKPEAVPWLVGLYIASAYWFTASTSFANPAVTIGRTVTATFSGIRPWDAPAFIGAQLAGALLASLVFRWLLNDPSEDGA